MLSNSPDLISRRKAARSAYKNRATNGGGFRPFARFATRQGILAIAAAVIFGVPIVAAAADAALHAGRIHSGVFIGETPVGRLTPGEAAALLKKNAGAALKKRVVVSHGGKEWKLEKKDISPNADTKTAVAAAMKVGRSGGFFPRMGARFALYSKPKTIGLPFDYNRAFLKGFVSEIAKTVDKEPTNAGVEIEGEEIGVTPSKRGRAVQRQKLTAAIKDKIFSMRAAAIVLPVESVGALVTEAEAKLAVEQTKKALASPIKLSYSEDEWMLDTDDIRRMLTFVPKKEGKGSTLALALDPKEFTEKLGSLTEKYSTEPKNAKFSVSGRNVSVIPHKPGEEIDAEAARIEAEKNLSVEGERLVALVLHKVDPDRTTEKAESMGIVELIDSFTTRYPANNRPRVTNIRVLAKALDGTLVGPGETFSFNGVIGPRTAAKGYKEAPVIRDGELVPDIGGGVCQVATTVFNAAFFAGLPIPERRNHSLYIAKYPDGRDASVSYPSPDLQFKNDTQSYIMIVANAGSSSVTVALYGTDPDRTVRYKSSGFKNLRPFKEEIIKDATLLEGERKVDEKGKPGRSITVKRTVLKDGEELWVDTFVSRYRTEDAVIRVGTKKAAATASSTEDASD